VRCKTMLLIAALTSRAWGQTASVSGVVTDSLTGAPLPRVHVVLKDPADNAAVQYGAQTTDAGKFSITGIAPGSYSVSGERVGFARSRINTTLKADDKTANLELKLLPVGAIMGRITDAEGQPVDRASVTTEGVTRKEAATDEQGQFRIGGLAPGKYRVKAEYESPMYSSLLRKPAIRADGTRELHNAATYYPGVLAAKQAGKVEVRPAAESTGIDIQLVGVPLVRISGKVVGMPRGAPNAFVWISSGGYPLMADGSFELWDPAGKYRLAASWSSPEGHEQSIFGPQASTAPVEIEAASSNIDNIELRMVPDSDIAGRLEFETPPGMQPVPGRAVILRGNPAPVGPDDTFRLEHIPADKYYVSLSWDGAYVKSMRLGTTAIDGAVLDLTNGSGGADLTLVLSTAMGSVSGIAKPEATVVLTHAGFPPRYTEAKQDGAFSFPNLAPGNYKLAAADDDEDSAESVEIHAGDKLSVDIRP
jgi:hypothetical protein